MNDDSGSNGCTYLTTPISLSDLVGSGSQFAVNLDFDNRLAEDFIEELGLGANEEDKNNTIDYNAVVSPWNKPYPELKLQMEQISDLISKKLIKKGIDDDGPMPINARVCIRYNAYMEGEDAPYDSSFLRGEAHYFHTDRGEILTGLEEAVRTMHTGEQSMFIISYKLLFGELGCPPRIRPRADGLFIIELVSYSAVGDIDADAQLAQEDRTKYAVVINKVKEIYVNGLHMFEQSMYRNAIIAFEKAVSMLRCCQLANEEEERANSAFLVKLFTNLAVCYLKVNQPRRTCIIYKEICQITKNKPSCKAIFQEGRALHMLGEFGRAKIQLTRALRMEPLNVSINNELKELEKHFSRHKEGERVFWSKAFQIVHKAEEQTPLPDTKTQFEQEMLEEMKAFQADSSEREFHLPSGLTSIEMNIVNVLAEKMELRVSKSPLDESYSLFKQPKVKNVEV